MDTETRNIKSILSSGIRAISDFLYTHKKTIITVVIVLLFLLPFVKPGRYFVRISSLIFIYAMLALSLNLVTGYLGQTSMGHAALFCVGAYVSALLSVRVGGNFYTSLIGGTFAAALAGAFLGIVTVRLSGSYFAITTLGFAEVIRMISLNWETVTYGAMGVKNIPRPTFFGIELTNNNYGTYWISLVTFLVVLLFCVLLIKSKFGRAIIAIREDNLAATLMGINEKVYRVATIAIAGALAGVAGSLYSHTNQYIDPNTFSFDVSTIILSLVIFGGMGTISGPILGAIVLISFPEVLRSFQQYRFIVYGFILVLMMRFRPQGVLGGLSNRPCEMPKGVKLPEIDYVISSKKDKAKEV